MDDLRKKGPTHKIMGVSVFGEAIDFRNDRNIVVGNFRGDEPIQIWDLRHAFKPFKSIHWDGGYHDCETEESKLSRMTDIIPSSPLKRHKGKTDLINFCGG